MFSALQDLRLAVRQLLRSGTFTFTVVLTLAVGIGLNAAIFTMVDCVLLRPLGYHDADRIYSLNTRFLDEGRSIASMGGGDFMDLTRGVQSLEHVAYYSGGKDGLQVDGRSLYLDISYVSPDFGQVMGVEPVVGRLFHTDVDGREAMVSSAFARENFGKIADAIGKAIRSGGTLYTIVSVLPDGFSFPRNTQVWIEDPAAPENLNRTAYNQHAIGKAKLGVTAEMLNAEMATLSRQLASSYPEDKRKALEAVSLQEQLVGKIRPTLRLLMGSVAVVLLIVCANITHLQLVRATQLRREVTIRTALGATRFALAKRAAIEVLLLAAGGCAAGVLVALPALRLLVRLAPRDIPRLADVHLNLDVIGFSFLVSVVTMGVTSLLPLWRSWRLDPASAMKQDSARGTESRGSGRLRQGLIVGEVALTLMLSVAALLLVRQLIAEANQDLGFAPDKLVLLDTHNGTGEPGQVWVNALNRMVDDVRAVPGVVSAAAISGAPMGLGRADVGYAVHGKSEFKAGAKLPDADIMPITPGYFETMGMRVIAGRGIGDADREGSEKVLVISQSMAAQSFAGEDPIGRQIMCGYDEMNPTWWTIVGVVSDVREESPASAPAAAFYVPIAQHPARAADMEVMVRTRIDAAVVSATLEKRMKQQFPAVAVQSTTMRENIGESERAQRFRTLLFGSFAGVSILLAVTGMYGVTAYTVAQRRFEFALRFAVGAQRRQVLGSVLWSAMAVAAVGVAGGVALSVALMRVISTLLGEMAAFDLVSYGIAAAAVLLV